MPAHVIAEAGTNHGGDLSMARRLVDIAVSAGADSFKVQMIYPDGSYVPEFYQDGTYAPNEVFGQRSATMLTDKDYRALAEYCRSSGVEFAATVFDARGISLADSLDVPYLKIASCDLNDSRHLRDCASTGRRIVLSTGMATLIEVDRAVSEISSMGNSDIVLMHCVSVYPCPIDEMNLAFVGTLRDNFPFPVGLSDHTDSSLPAIVACGIGATWFEKHFTYDRTVVGSDHHFSLGPEEFRAYVGDVRSAETTIAQRPEKIGQAEHALRSRVRRGLYAARNISAEEVIEDCDILVVRPSGPLAPDDVDLVVGHRAARDIARYEPLSLLCVH